MDSVSYMIEIQAKMAGADTSVTKLKQLERSIKAEGDALKRLDAEMKKMQRGNSVSIEGYRRLQSAIGAQKQKIGSLVSQYLSEAAASEHQRAQTEAAAAAKDKAARATERLRNTFRRLAAATVVFKVIGAAAKAAAQMGIGFVKAGLAAGSSSQQMHLNIEGHLKSARAAAETNSQIKYLASTTGIARGALGGYAIELIKAGLSGRQLRDALRGAAFQAGGLGEADVGKLIEDLKFGRTTAAKFAAEMEKTYGATARKRAASFEAQIARVKDAMADAFEGMDISSVAKSIAQMVRGIGEWLAANMPKINLFFLSFRVGALKALVAIKPLISGIAEFGGLTKSSDKAGDSVSRIGETAGMVAGGIAGMITSLIVAITGLVNRLIEFIDSIAGRAKNVQKAMKDGTAVDIVRAVTGHDDEQSRVGRAVVGDAAAAQVLSGKAIAGDIEALKGLQQAAVAGNAEAMKGLQTAAAVGVEGAKEALVAAGKALADGMAKGIGDGSPEVQAAAQALVAAAKQATMGALDAHSPSRLFARLGRWTAAGYAGGVEGGTAEAEGAVERMVNPPVVRAPDGSRGRSGGVTVHVGGITITGVPDAPSILDRIEERIAAAIEGVAFEEGAMSS